MSDPPQIGTAALAVEGGESRLRVGGDWTLAHYHVLASRVTAMRALLTAETQISFDNLGVVDTAGASLLVDLLGAEPLRQCLEADASLTAERRALLKAVCVARAGPGILPAPIKHSAIGDKLEQIGVAVSDFWGHAINLLGFIGLTLETAARVILLPRRWRLTSLAANLEKNALNAVPIIALLTFLVGAVVAFLGATVLTDFGAGIYTVNLVVYSFLREFGALLTAILVAGRTASAFTAQIGSMRVNEEVDAIRVLGLSPIELLVLPRVYSMMIALPLLTFIAMISGIVGGMLVCALSLDISPTMFLSILENNIGLRHFLVGMAKAPVFAFLIAIIGCLEGFKVSGSAQSVGEHTTSAVVQSIFIVILIDAVAALFYMEMGW